MTRVSTSPGRDISKPLVEVDTESRLERAGLTLFRGVVVFGFALAFVGAISMLLLLTIAR